ncbi:hypothetical protein Moror_2332 [Moniliophthora roreri MCA 2997]|uniref:F-box domain-containing protein n=1 Tax=Moniliophthora roreri (strain MCA 2997) TaxID=1381753 RepID=V2WZB6_MONRO|nr:hypothetical protein Moror_2332 [Moniliophthora roreri MCA 2997]
MVPHGHATDVILCTSCGNKLVPESIWYPPVPATSLRSNHTPSRTEIARNSAILEAEEHDLRRYDEEIERLRLAVEKLEGARDGLFRKMEARRSWMAPIRRLPIEILERVFIDVCRMSEYSLRIHFTEHGGNTTTTVDATTLWISHVSNHWRNIACANQYLWSSLSLDLHDMTEDPQPLLELYLGNAAEHPLKMRICYPGDDTYVVYAMEQVLAELDGYRLSSILRTMTTHFPRCEELYINMPPRFLASILRERTTFPLLRTFFVDRNEPKYDEEGNLVNRHFWDAIHEAPLLREAHLDSVWPWYGLDYFPWERLTSLEVDYIDEYDDFFHILLHCHFLQSLTIYALGQHFRDLPAIDPVMLPHLQEFGLTSNSALSDSIHCILASMILPSLVSIFLETPPPWVYLFEREFIWNFRYIYDMIQRSSSSMTKLTLNRISNSIVNEPFETFSDVLKACPCLEYLHVDLMGTRQKEANKSEASFISNVRSLLSLSSMPWRINQAAVVPRLKQILIHERTQKPLDLQEMEVALNLVEERSARHLAAVGRTDVYPLTEACLHFCATTCLSRLESHSRNAIHPAHKERLAALKMDGTMCYVGWY